MSLSEFIKKDGVIHQLMKSFVRETSGGDRFQHGAQVRGFLVRFQNAAQDEREFVLTYFYGKDHINREVYDFLSGLIPKFNTGELDVKVICKAVLAYYLGEQKKKEEFYD